jgi:hypothetical protein
LQPPLRASARLCFAVCYAAIDCRPHLSRAIVGDQAAGLGGFKQAIANFLLV